MYCISERIENRIHFFRNSGFAFSYVFLRNYKIFGKRPVTVYTNTYFEFFSRGLHSFTVTKAVTWSEAIPESYMSDIEELTTEESRKIKNTLRDLKKQMK